MKNINLCRDLTFLCKGAGLNFQMLKKRYIPLIIVLFLIHTFLAAQGKGTFIISSPQETAQLVISNNEDHLVVTAAELFAGDVYKISNRKPELKSSGTSVYQVMAGTLGINNNFDNACKKAGINTERLKSVWEGYIIKSVTSRKKNVLFIVGSNARGTAFGLMELSLIIGVSPWYWWADVKPLKKDVIEVPGNLLIEDAPKVKFRGIFLNDEDWGLQPWAAKTFEPETGDIGPKTYEKIFELLLRLKSNYIWPAMHNCTRAFFTYPGNIKMADKYGIWVGSSHCEPMLRNNVDEWYRWNPPTGKRGPWNFDENPEKIEEYWKERVDTTSHYDGIYTIGMRGIHDGSMPGGKNLADKVQILDRVFDAQREILHDVTGKDVTTIPQIFCPYKEVLDVYRAGAKVPDDVTIMWADDNNGYIRQLSNTEERKRSGGAGVYYHISYWGRPHDFLWIESMPASLIWEEMHKAFETNAKNVWIVNVGDIKGNEIGMNFFLNMAWNPDKYSPENLQTYYSDFAEHQFGSEYSKEIGEILKQYFQLGFSRKPEHMGWNAVYPNTPIHDPALSLFNYGDEVQQRIDAYDELEKQAEKLYEKMPDRLKDAFFELIGYKVTGASNMNKKILYAYKSRIYEKLGRTSANTYAAKAEKAFDRIKEITNIYNNIIADGKWKNMMTYNPRQLPVFDMPETGNYNPTQQSAGSVLPEGYSTVPSGTFSLPDFNSLTKRSYFVDVFNAGQQPINWEAKVTDGWVNVSKTSGQTETGDRVWVSVNWEKVPATDSAKSVINFKINDLVYPVRVMVKNIKLGFDDKNIFVEDNGIVAIEAEDYTNIQNVSDCKWQTIIGLGREGDAVGTFPITAKPFGTAGLNKSPELSYNFFTTSMGEAKLFFYCIPTLPINDDYSLRFAVSIDNVTPIIVNAALKDVMDENNPEWRNNVLCAITIQEIKALIPENGKHNLSIRMIDPGVVIDKIEIVTGERRNSYFGAQEH
jgi:hypothetical protein